MNNLEPNDPNNLNNQNQAINDNPQPHQSQPQSPQSVITQASLQPSQEQQTPIDRYCPTNSPTLKKNKWMKSLIVVVAIITMIIVYKSFFSKTQEYLTESMVLEIIKKEDNTITTIEDFSIRDLGVNCGLVLFCTDNAIHAISYGGFFKSEGTNFSMPFLFQTNTRGENLILKKKPSDIKLFSGTKWNSFVETYNTTGYSRLEGLYAAKSEYDLNYLGAKSSSKMFGYKISDTYVAYSSVWCGDLFPHFCEGTGGKTPIVIGYKEDSNKWQILTEDGWALKKWMRLNKTSGNLFDDYDWASFSLENTDKIER